MPALGVRDLRGDGVLSGNHPEEDLASPALERVFICRESRRLGDRLAEKGRIALDELNESSFDELLDPDLATSLLGHHGPNSVELASIFERDGEAVQVEIRLVFVPTVVIPVGLNEHKSSLIELPGIIQYLSCLVK